MRRWTTSPSRTRGSSRLIAERITDNVRSLEGALIRVVAQHSLTGRPIDAELADAVLGPIRADAGAAGHGNGALTIAHIQESVAEHFKLAPSDLTGASRIATVVWARQLAVHLSRELTDASLQRIGEAFGGRNHATVLHACRRVADRISVNNDDAADLQHLKQIATIDSHDRAC